MEKKHLTPIKVYSLIVSAAAMVAILISLSVSVYSLLKQTIISEDEYLLSRGGYFDSYMCEQENGIIRSNVDAVAVADGTNTEIQQLTTEQIDACKVKQRERDLAWRSIDYKETLIRSATWFVVSLFALLIHLPMMLKSKDKEQDSNE